MRATQVQVLGLALLLAAMAGALGAATQWSPRFAFLRQDESALWIGSPDPISTGTIAAPRDRLHVVVFERRFRLGSAQGPLRVRIEALRGYALEVNDRLSARREWNEGNWRQPRTLEVTEGLVAGENAIRVRVRNPTGPPLLRLAAEAPGVRLATDASWETRRDAGPPRPARPADDTLRSPAALTVPPLSRSLAAKWTVLLAIFVVCGLVSAALQGDHAAAMRRRLPQLLWVPIALLWLGVFAFQTTRLPEYAGFDGPDHLDYVHYVLERRALPLADEGPHMYQPPLFYVLSAGMLWLFEGTQAPPRVVLRLLPLACGLLQVGVAFLLARQLFPADRLRIAAATLAAAALPLNLTMSAYLGNEPLHAALAALSLLLATQLLLAPGAPWRQVLAVGVVLGLAILSKVSSLLLVPVLAAFLAAKLRLADRRSLPFALLRAAGLVALAAAVSGGFFLRNQLHFGRALIGNWDVPGNPVAWWQHPGFHTPTYYLRFGESLRRPFFAAFESFWDGLYSTFWGDGLVGGVASWAQRHPLWDYDYMAAGYALALPATALLLFGYGRLVAASLRGEDLRRRAALSLLTTAAFVTLFAALFMTLVLPAYSMTKASYLLSVTAPLALAFADGFARLHRVLDTDSRRWLQLLLHAWAGTLLAVIALSFAG